MAGRNQEKLAVKMKGRRARSSRLPFPHAGKPADLTEGGQPVVCWLPIKPMKHANGFVQDVKKIRIFMKSLWD